MEKTQECLKRGSKTPEAKTKQAGVHVLDNMLFKDVLEVPLFWEIDALLDHPITTELLGRDHFETSLVSLLGKNLDNAGRLIEVFNEVHRGVTAFIQKLETGANHPDLQLVLWRGLVVALETTRLDFSIPETAEGQRLLTAWRNSTENWVHPDWPALLDDYLTFLDIHHSVEADVLKDKLASGQLEWLQRWEGSKPIRQKDMLAKIQKVDERLVSRHSTHAWTKMRELDRSEDAKEANRGALKFATSKYKLNVATQSQ